MKAFFSFFLVLSTLGRDGRKIFVWGRVTLILWLELSFVEPAKREDVCHDLRNSAPLSVLSIQEREILNMASTAPKQAEFRSPKFAFSDSSRIYHLLYLDNKHTLCGFRVESSDANLPVKTEFHVVEIAPSNHKLCKHCSEMDERRLKASVDQTERLETPEGFPEGS